MKVFSVIFGILLAMCGITCMATPIVTTFSLMYFYLVLLFVIGVVMLLKCIVYKSYGIDFIFSIITIILGILVLLSPNASKFVADMVVVLIYIMATWFIIHGVVGIVTAAQARAVTGNGVFAFAVIVSVLTLLLGIYSFIHPIVFTGVIGILTGMYFVMEGFDLIVFSLAAPDDIDE